MGVSPRMQHLAFGCLVASFTFETWLSGCKRRLSAWLRGNADDFRFSRARPAQCDAAALDKAERHLKDGKTGYQTVSRSSQSSCMRVAWPTSAWIPAASQAQHVPEPITPFRRFNCSKTDLTSHPSLWYTSTNRAGITYRSKPDRKLVA